jgi:hypothetical protein
MSDTNSGMSRWSGFFALGPMISSVPTCSPSCSGRGSSWAAMIWMSSQDGSSVRGTPIAVIGPSGPNSDNPFTANAWMKPTYGSSVVERGPFASRIGGLVSSPSFQMVQCDASQNGLRVEPPQRHSE